MTPSLKLLYQTLKTQLAPVVSSPEHLAAEVSLLLQFCLNRTLKDVYQENEETLTHGQVEALSALVERRVQERIPIQYLLGEAHFYGLTLKVTPAVLIPRPDTELLVDTALTLCQAHGYKTVLDIGTGSGAIALAMAARNPSLQVTATDLSAEALVIAQENARRLGFTDRIRFRQGSLFKPVSGERFDLILSNPPYVDDTTQERLAPEVRDHEPAMALFSPQGRTWFYEKTARQAPDFLTPGGAVAVEIDGDLGAAVTDLFQSAGFKNIQIRQDAHGLDRVLEGSLVIR